MKRSQYTIRQVPDHVDRALRQKAKRKGLSLNQVVLETLAQSVGEDSAKYHDLDALCGTWKQDKFFDDAMGAFDEIDDEAWK